MVFGKRSLSFEELMQATPNYPPYAMEIVGERGGEAVFGGNISAAMLASLNADIVLACDLNPHVVEFYRHLVEEMKATESAEDFSRKFNEMLDAYKRSGVIVSTGPLSFLPFVIDPDVYQLVRPNLGKLQIHQGDFTEFIGWLRDEGRKASVIDANNIPEYVNDWRRLFANPPLEDGGITLFGKRDRKAYLLPDGSIHPGKISRGINGHAAVAPEDGMETITVAEAMAQIGYAQISVPLISNIRETKEGKLTYSTEQSLGVRNIILIEEINHPDSSTGESHQILRGGTHSLHTFQYAPSGV